MESKTSQPTKGVVAKKLRTGELAVWDQSERAIILISPVTKEGTATTRVIKGSTLKALEEALGDVVVLI